MQKMRTKKDGCGIESDTCIQLKETLVVQTQLKHDKSSPAGQICIQSKEQNIVNRSYLVSKNFNRN